MAKWSTLLTNYNVGLSSALTIGEKQKSLAALQTLHLADDLDRQTPIHFTDNELSKHTHIVGASGSGKSVLLYKLSLKLIHSRAGGIIIDPHSSLYSSILAYVSTQASHLAERIIFFSPFDDVPHTVGYSPIPKSFRDDEVSNIASSIVLAILKVYNQEPQQLPRTVRMLYSILLPIVQNRLSLLETEFFLLHEYEAQRQHLLKTVKDPWVLSEWAEFEKLPILRKSEYIESSLNRLRPILTNPYLRLMLGNTTNCLDIGEIMKQGKVLVVSLKAGEKVQVEEANLVGALLLNSVYQAAIKRNPEENNVPFRVIVDEFQNVMCDFVVGYFYELRKFAVSFILAHQSLAQLEKDGDKNLLAAISNNCANKFVFRLGDYEDAVKMAHQILIQDVSLLTPKYTEWTEKQRPYQSLAKTLTESCSTSESSSVTKGESQGSSTSTSEGRREQYLLSNNEPENNLPKTTDQTGYTSSTTINESRGRTTTTGQSVTYNPITLHETYFEGKTTYYSLPELLHTCVVRLMKQQVGECTIKLDGRKQAVRTKIVFTKPPETNPFTTSLMLKSLWEKLITQHSQYYQPRENIQNQIAKRREQVMSFTSSSTTVTPSSKLVTEGEHKDLFSPADLREKNQKKAKSIFTKTVGE